MLRLFAAACLTMAWASSAIAQADYTEKMARYESRRVSLAKPVNLMIGDSITEAMGHPLTFGGCTFHNAGFGGINAQTMDGLMDDILRNSRVGYAVIMLGTNNALPGMTDADAELYYTAYASIVRKIESNGGIVVSVQIPPIEPGKSLSYLRTQDSVNILNRLIYYRLIYVNGQTIRKVVSSAPLYDAATNAAKPGTTTDGIHFTATTNTTVKGLIGTAVQAERTRTGRPCS